MLSRNRLMGTLLIVSWTLNVALGVALYYSMKSPHEFHHPFPPKGLPLEGPPPPGMGMPPGSHDALRKMVKPLVSEQQTLARELYQTLTADSLDSARVGMLSDSLGEIRHRMQAMMIRHMSGLHSQLSPEERETIYSRMVGKLSFEGYHHKRFHDGPGHPPRFNNPLPQSDEETKIEEK